jgi:pyrimidine-nucleoside phosphorylase
MDTAGIGVAAMMLGAGRETTESRLDYHAGIILAKKTGDAVKKGDTVATLFASEESRLQGAEERFLEALAIRSEAPQKEPLIYARVTDGEVHRGKEIWKE